MKRSAKILLILSTLFFIAITRLVAQTDTPAAEPDDEFNLFLLTLALIAFCAMIGAALIGAAVALLILLFLFALMSVGILSTSVAVGFYRRSYSAGFKSFLILLFGLSCAAIGGIGVWLLHYFLTLPVGRTAAVGLGLVSGLLGGWLMALATYSVIRQGANYIVKKLALGSRNISENKIA